MCRVEEMRGEWMYYYFREVNKVMNFKVDGKGKSWSIFIKIRNAFISIDLDSIVSLRTLFTSYNIASVALVILCSKQCNIKNCLI